MILSDGHLEWVWYGCLWKVDNFAWDLLENEHLHPLHTYSHMGCSKKRQIFVEGETITKELECTFNALVPLMLYKGLQRR